MKSQSLLSQNRLGGLARGQAASTSRIVLRVDEVMLLEMKEEVSREINCGGVTGSDDISDVWGKSEAAALLLDFGLLTPSLYINVNSA